MLRGLKSIIAGSGLDTKKIVSQWGILEHGVAVWLKSGHLSKLILEVWAEGNSARLIGRFDFTIDYVYGSDGEGDLWLDSAAVAWIIKKHGLYPANCSYRIVADTSDGAPAVDGWSTTRLVSTSGLTQHSIGAVVGGGTVGATLSYWR
jgi:hypothetical protein